ncbi:efflux RND transporter periplasmic adaptor subunit [Enterobacter ludwigii]|uniref:efflux RND transporter periplasmic adaptor subunit n=1 Tax=Enterobacter ludwigii TaxID=299767 RepID=UPI003FD2A08F
MKVKSLILTSFISICVICTLSFLVLSADGVTETVMKETYQVEYADIEQHLTMTGVLKPKEQVSVGAQVNGRLNKLHVKEGEPVKKGQLLAEIDPTLAQNDVDNAKAELNTALVQKKITSLSLRQSLSDYNRQKKMLAEDATTLSDLENAKTNYQIVLSTHDMSKLTELNNKIHYMRLAIFTGEMAMRVSVKPGNDDGIQLKSASDWS